MPGSNPPDIMDDPTFDQMCAEAVQIIGEDTVFAYLEPICGRRNPHDLNRAERTAFMIYVGLRCREAWGKAGHA